MLTIEEIKISKKTVRYVRKKQAKLMQSQCTAASRKWTSRGSCFDTGVTHKSPVLSDESIQWNAPKIISLLKCTTVDNIINY